MIIEKAIQKEQMIGNTVIGHNSFGYAIRKPTYQIEIVHLDENGKLYRDTEKHSSVFFTDYFIMAKDPLSDSQVYVKYRKKKLFDNLKNLAAYTFKGIPELVDISSSRKHFLVNNIGEYCDLGDIQRKVNKDNVRLNSLPIAWTYQGEIAYLLHITTKNNEHISYLMLNKHLMNTGIYINSIDEHS